MTSRSTSWLLALALALAGCEDSVPTLTVGGTPMQSVDLAPPDDGIPTDLGHYRWEAVETPPGVTLGELTEETADVTITPPVRGVYVLDRWFAGQGGEDLSYRVIVVVDGLPPIARIAGPNDTAVGSAAMFDGGASSSLEQFDLSFEWRLAERPAASAAEITGASQRTMMLVPDAAGSYLVELRAFDGELWSRAVDVTLTAH